MSSKPKKIQEASKLEEAFDDYTTAFATWRSILDHSQTCGKELGNLSLYKLKKNFRLSDMLEALGDLNVNVKDMINSSPKAKKLKLWEVVEQSMKMDEDEPELVKGENKIAVEQMVASALEIADIMDQWDSFDCWKDVNIFETPLSVVREKLHTKLSGKMAQAATDFKTALDAINVDATDLSKELWAVYTAEFKKLNWSNEAAVQAKVKEATAGVQSDLDIASLTDSEKKVFDELLDESCKGYLGGLSLADFEKAHFLTDEVNFIACHPHKQGKKGEKKGVRTLSHAPSLIDTIHVSMAKIDPTKRPQAEALFSKLADSACAKNKVDSVDDLTTCDLRSSDLHALPIGLKNILLETSSSRDVDVSVEAVDMGCRDLGDHMEELRGVLRVHDHLAIPLKRVAPESFHHGVVVSTEGEMQIANFGHADGANGPCINPDGVILEYHNVPCIVTLRRFCEFWTKKIYIIKHTNRLPDDQIADNIARSIAAGPNGRVPLFRNMPYKLHTNNCEHYVRAMITGDNNPPSYSVSRTWCLAGCFLVLPGIYAAYTRHKERRFSITNWNGDLVMRDGVFRRPHRW